MPYEVVTADVQAAIEAVLEADTGLVAALASKPSAKGGGPGIYTDGDSAQGAMYPYLTIGVWTQNPFHNFSPSSNGFGWLCTGQIKAIGQRSQQLTDVMSEVFGVLEQGTRIELVGYTAAWCGELRLQPEFKSIIAGVTTYELPAILEVYVTP